MPRRRVGSLPVSILALLLVGVLASGVRLWARPSSVRITVGMEQTLSFRIPISLSITPTGGASALVNGRRIASDAASSFRSPVHLTGEDAGTITVSLRLFGVLPVRRMELRVLPDVKVVPGGQAIGVLLTSKGVIVVAHTALDGLDGVRRYPAEEAGIRIGDVIVKVDGEDASSTEGVSRLVAKHAAQGRPLDLLVRRDGHLITKEITPVLTRMDSAQRGLIGAEYKMGVYVEDNVAGVGTLTFFYPATGTYAALGHVITDGSTPQPVEVKEGRIVRAGISGIQQGYRGQPGEKIGAFEAGSDIEGDIHKNTTFGIYGHLTKTPASTLAPVPIAVASQIRVGPADMLTVVASNQVERFRVEIQRVYRQGSPQTKGLVLKVVDPRLLKLTGGIIQGMSGSPLLQNGRLIGAVTHVFVNDPTRGYGVLAEWMVMEAGLTSASSGTPAKGAA